MAVTVPLIHCLVKENHTTHKWWNEGFKALCPGVGTPIQGESMDRVHPTGTPERDTDVARTVKAIHDWWINTAQDEVARVAPKAVEYGSTDLVDIGKDLARLIGWSPISDEEAAELGIYFYMVGKMARWSDAIQRHARVSDDTLHDAGVYVRMAQRVRAVGGWPFGPVEDGKDNDLV